MLLIDADITVYSSIAAVQEDVEVDGEWTIKADMWEAKSRFERWIETVLTAAGMKEFKLCFSGDQNFRKEINPSYKGNRKDRKPVGYRFLKDWAKETYPFFEKPCLEADDAMGILATKFPGKAFPLTMDKDLLTIPGRMFHINQKLEGEWVTTSEDEAFRNFLRQTLMGDTTDGYGGCPGIGPKTADVLFKKHGVAWKTVEDAFKKAGLTSEDALLNARMARILRVTDWDAPNEQPILWTP